MSARIPSYRFHKARNCAVVTIAGKDHYLGDYDSPSSHQKYHALISEYLANCVNTSPHALPPVKPLTITELVAQYWQFAKSYYVKNGSPTSELHVIKSTLRFVRRLYGDTLARDFDPKKLKAVRQAMITHEIIRNVKIVDDVTGHVVIRKKVVQHGISRSCINKMIGRIKRMFSWAVEEGILPASIHLALVHVSGLRRGKSLARETARVTPVSTEQIEAVLPHVPAAVRIMIELQRYSGCRPQEVVQLRGVDIDQTLEIWEYRPQRHKTEHHNEESNPDLD